MKCGCENCKWLKVYKGGYWDPDDYDCMKDGPETQELCDRVWANGETWNSDDKPLCCHWEELKEEW